MSDQLHVCHAFAGKPNSTGRFGGLEKYVIDLATAQVHTGLRVSVICSTEWRPYFPSEVEIYEGKLDRSRYNPLLYIGLSQLVERIGPDLLSVHANKAAQIFNRVRVKVPRVATVHNVKKKTSMFVGYDAVICGSQLVAQSLGDLSAEVIWNTVAKRCEEHVDIARKLEPPFIGEGSPIFLAAARFVEAKGFDLLLEAFAQTQNGFLWLVGDGKQRRDLEDLVARHKLQGRVWMPGFLAPEEVLGLMQMADCFVVSSRNEGGPYTLAEALRARCAVVSTKVGYAPEFLTETQLISEMTAEAIAEKLNDIIAVPDRYKASMHRIFDVVERELDVEIMVRKVVDVYKEVLKTKR